MNRKGHIGTALLPVLALILVINSFVVMSSFNSDVVKIKSEFGSLSGRANAEHNLIIENIEVGLNQSIELANITLFEQDLNKFVKEFANTKRDSSLNTNLYAKIALGNYSLLKNRDSYELTVLDVFENYNLNNNEVAYSYSLKVVFDKDKVISIEEIVE